jgi:hypothetical protein
MSVIYVSFKSANEELFDKDEKEVMDYLRRKVRDEREVSVRVMVDGLSIVFGGDSKIYMLSVDGGEYKEYRELLRSIMI